MVKSLFFNSTLFILLFFHHHLLLRRSLWSFFQAILLNQRCFQRWLYFNFLCLFEYIVRFYFSLKYYFIKYHLAFFHRLGFFSKRLRLLLLNLEYLKQGITLGVFDLNFFCYYKFSFKLPLILPFQRYFLRLDIYSFFFLWSAMEAIRIAFYNDYIRTHPELFRRPLLRHCFIQAWFPKRRAYVAIRSLPILHLPQFEKTSLRQRLSERFSIMLFHKKYILLNLLQSKSFLFRQLDLPFTLNFVLQKDATLHWLFSLSQARLSIFGLLMPWAWANICNLFFLYTMRHPKRYPVDRWRLTRYFLFFTRSLVIAYFTAELYVIRGLRTFSTLFTRRLYHRLFSLNYVQHAFLLQDLYHYHSFSWEAFLSFIDRHFCYRVLSMKFNWFFDNYFLKAHSLYMGITFGLVRPFPKKPTPEQLVPRRRAFFFAKRFLLRFCSLPLYFSFTLLGLEYFYWRIYEYTSSSLWLDDWLPLSYYYLKLNIDRLLLSRYLSMVRILQASTLESLPTIYKKSSFMLQNKPIFYAQRWDFRLQFAHLNPWILMHFSAFKSIFLQALNSKLPLALLAFYLYKEKPWDDSLEDCWAEKFFLRSLVVLENAQKIHSFVCLDQELYRRPKVLWDAPRAKKWLASFDERKPPSPSLRRYGINYRWLRTNPATWVD